MARGRNVKASPVREKRRSLALAPMKRRLAWVGIGFSVLAALYCAAGVLQAASLFTEVQAQRNFEVWGSLFLVCCALLVLCAVTLWFTRPKGASNAHDA